MREELKRGYDRLRLGLFVAGGLTAVWVWAEAHWAELPRHHSLLLALAALAIALWCGVAVLRMFEKWGEHSAERKEQRRIAKHLDQAAKGGQTHIEVQWAADIWAGADGASMRLIHQRSIREALRAENIKEYSGLNEGGQVFKGTLVSLDALRAFWRERGVIGLRD